MILNKAKKHNQGLGLSKSTANWKNSSKSINGTLTPYTLYKKDSGT